MHVVLGEVAALKVKVCTIHGDEFWQQHALRLLLVSSEVIAVDEAASFLSVAVKVQIECKT